MSSERARFLVGIDLGTINSALAFADLAAEGDLATALAVMPIPQLVASAKSWLSHPRVDRTAAILPWGAPEGVPRLSPVDASALYLAHLREAWSLRFPGAPLASQEIV